MKVLMLSTDKNIFRDGHPSQERMKDYGGLVGELHIVIYTAKSEKLKTKNIKENVFLYPTRTPFGLFCFYLFNVWSISRRIIRKEHGWLVTAQDPFETGLAGYLVKRFYNARLQIQIHTDFLSPYFGQESFRNKIRVILGKRIIKEADGLRVVSERIKNSLVASGYALKPITVLPIVYDMDRFSKNSIKTDLHSKYPRYEHIILLASRLTIEKNIGLAIKAMKAVVADCPKTLLLIVGDGPEAKKSKLLTIRYSLQTNVIFEPWTNDIISYYRTADIFVLTSNYEGGARAPAEAVASGLPVVMTDVPPARETVIDGQNGFVVPVNDYRQLADRLIELISNESKRIMFKKQSLAMAVGFITKEVYLKLYYQALVSALSQK